MFETIQLTKDARGVATLTLDRPDKLNALSGTMIAELHSAARQIEADGAIRVVVLRGAGRAFCAGGDLGWMRDQITASAADRADGARKLAAMLGAINALPKPVIAAVHGGVFGGGVGLCCVADIVFAADTATFGLTETKLGLIPATIGPYVLARMGEGAARQVFMSSRPFDAIAAQRLGIVSDICAAGDLDAAVAAEVDAYLKCAPAAVAEAKALALRGAPDEAAIAASIAALVQRWEHPEALQGITAFFDKTDPPWVTKDA